MNDKVNTVVIGKLIKEELQRQGKTSVWLANELGCHRTNIYKVYDRTTIDTGMLFHISKILKVDFSSTTQMLFLPSVRSKSFRSLYQKALPSVIYWLR